MRVKHKFFMTQNNPLFKTGYLNEVYKEFKETGPEKPMKFLVIVMYAKESIRLMKFKENSYLIKKPCTKNVHDYIKIMSCVLIAFYVYGM